MLERPSNLQRSRHQQSTTHRSDSAAASPTFEFVRSFLDRFSDSKRSIESALARCHALDGHVHRRNTLQQLERVGPRSAGVYLLTVAFVGMAFIQFVRKFTRLDLHRSVGSVLALALSRELSPVITAVVIAGHIGSAFAAELGTMKSLSRSTPSTSLVPIPWTTSSPLVSSPSASSSPSPTDSSVAASPSTLSQSLSARAALPTQLCLHLHPAASHPSELSSLPSHCPEISPLISSGALAGRLALLPVVLGIVFASNSKPLFHLFGFLIYVGSTGWSPRRLLLQEALRRPI